MEDGKVKDDALAKTQRMAKQKFRSTRLGGFSGAKAYIRYVEILKKRRNAAGRTFCDAIKRMEITAIAAEERRPVILEG
jgi:putative protease